MKAVVLLLALAAVAAAHEVRTTAEVEAEAMATAQAEAALGVKLSALHTPPALLETMREGEEINSAPVRCRRTLPPFTDPSVRIEDGSGRRDYDHNQKTCFIIQPANVPAGARVKLWFRPIDKEEGYDFIRIFDTATNQQIDDDADANVEYYSNKGFFIVFETDYSVSKQGWSAYWAVEAESADVTTDEISLATFPEENGKACKTEYYQNDGSFIVRRGCPFKAGISPSSVKPAKWRFRMTDVGTATKHELTCPGRSEYISCEAAGDQVAFTFAANAPIGIYDIDAVLQDGKVIGDDTVAYVLFNPWNKDDQTYMSNTAEINAHLVQSTGAVYTGNSPKAWNFGNNDMKVLKASFKAIASLTEAERALPWRVAREISWAANQFVLHGRWDGQYSDGKQPGYWPGSDVILAQWYDSNTRVKYGQCWVFSGVTSSISRSLGIPCRSHTNMNSAHERPPFDQKCHRYWRKSGSDYKIDDSKSRDSIWNFHVWNIGWFARPDLDNGKTPSWNAYDGTCQEMSDGRCQMGPARLSDTTAGKANAKFDNAFLMGETNCDIVNMVWDDDKKKDTEYSVDKCTVGDKTWTFPASGDMWRPEDASRLYKSEQCGGSSFLEMGSMVSAYEHITASGVKFSAKSPRSVVTIPEPVKMQLKISGAGKRDIAYAFTAYKVSTQDQKLDNKEAKVWEFRDVVKGVNSVEQVIPLEKLARAFPQTNTFRLTWSASVVGTKADLYVHGVTVTVLPPPMKFANANVQVGKETKTTMTWTNPLETDLKCRLKYSVGQSGRGFPEETFTVPRRGTVKRSVSVKTSRPGAIQGQATLTCDRLTEITGAFRVVATARASRRFARNRRPGKSGKFKIGPERSKKPPKGAPVRLGRRPVISRTSGGRHTRNPVPVPPRHIAPARGPAASRARRRRRQGQLGPRMKQTGMEAKVEESNNMETNEESNVEVVDHL